MWEGSKLGHCPPEEPSLLTPDDGALPPRGLTLNSEWDRVSVGFLPLVISACLSSLFISICIKVYTPRYSKRGLYARTCAVWGLQWPCKCPLVLKEKGISLFSEYVLQIDEHLQIALRCVNLRCEIIDLVRRLSHISGIDGFLSRLACDLGR